MDITAPGIYTLPISTSGNLLLSFEVIGQARIRIFLKTTDWVDAINKQSISFDEDLYAFEFHASIGNTVIFQVMSCDSIIDVSLVEANQ